LGLVLLEAPLAFFIGLVFVLSLGSEIFVAAYVVFLSFLGEGEVGRFCGVCSR
jgi:hypothetical protein